MALKKLSKKEFIAYMSLVLLILLITTHNTLDWHRIIAIIIAWIIGTGVLIFLVKYFFKKE